MQRPASRVIHDVPHQATYFEIDGTRWRVHDCAYEGRRFRRLVTPSSRAKYRVFVDQEGHRRAYLFTRGESHELTESRVEAQFLKAGIVFPPGHAAEPWKQPGQRVGKS